jgi:flagellin-like hook-associated protein FlgL
LANSKGSRGYLFAGTATGQAAFDQNGVFQGNDLDQVVELSPQQKVAVNASGAQAFTVAGGRDVFADLAALRTGLSNNDSSAVTATLGNLEQSQAQVVREQSRCGLVLDRFDTTDKALDTVDVELGRRESAAGSADPYESYARLNELSQALDRSVSVARQLLGSGQNGRF